MRTARLKEILLQKDMFRAHQYRKGWAAKQPPPFFLVTQHLETCLYENKLPQNSADLQFAKKHSISSTSTLCLLSSWFDYSLSLGYFLLLSCGLRQRAVLKRKAFSSTNWFSSITSSQIPEVKDSRFLSPNNALCTEGTQKDEKEENLTTLPSAPRSPPCWQLLPTPRLLLHCSQQSTPCKGPKGQNTAQCNHVAETFNRPIQPQSNHLVEAQPVFPLYRGQRTHTRLHRAVT